MFVLPYGGAAKNSSFANFGRGSARAICKCAVCGLGFLFVGGRKKQNKFPQVCTNLSTKNFSLSHLHTTFMAMKM